MSQQMALWIALGSAVVAVIYGLVTTSWVLAKPAGSDRMREIAAAVQEGAKAYMNRQYGTIGVVGVVLARSFPPWLVTSVCSYRSAPMCAPPKRRRMALVLR
jgi:Na+/H+-translocating membrane pyrophosphatase